MNKVFIVLIVSILSTMSIPYAVFAQDATDEPQEILADNAIAYGETLTGELDNRDFEIEYGFIGEEGDVVIIQMQSPELGGPMEYPALMLLDTEAAVVGSDDNYGSVILVYKLTQSGEYTIIATRRDGRAGTSIGEYNLTLLKAQDALGQNLSGKVDNETVVFYVVDTSAPFTVNYTREGDFYPEIAINITDNGVPETVASIAGKVNGGSLFIDPKALGSDLVLIRIAEAPFDYNFDIVTADVTIEVNQ